MRPGLLSVRILSLSRVSIISGGGSTIWSDASAMTYRKLHFGLFKFEGVGLGGEAALLI